MPEGRPNGGRSPDDDLVWPDDLEMGDCVMFAGYEWNVVGTGAGEASLERADDDTVTADVFRWAFSDSVGIEIETTYNQDEFGQLVNPDIAREEGEDA